MILEYVRVTLAKEESTHEEGGSFILEYATVTLLGEESISLCANITVAIATISLFIL